MKKRVMIRANSLSKKYSRSKAMKKAWRIEKRNVKLKRYGQYVTKHVDDIAVIMLLAVTLVVIGQLASYAMFLTTLL
jgi:hypothetical protein